MPVKKENKHLYPKNWKQISEYIRFERAGNKCEVCGVKNYAVGNRKNGEFIPTAGNIMHDSAGRGELTYKAATQLIKHCNEFCDDDLILIVLTVAHLDHDPTNNDYGNLKAMCQKCHNNYDKNHRKNNRKNQPQLFP